MHHVTSCEAAYVKKYVKRKKERKTVVLAGFSAGVFFVSLFCVKFRELVGVFGKQLNTGTDR